MFLMLTDFYAYNCKENKQTNKTVLPHSESFRLISIRLFEANIKTALHRQQCAVSGYEWL